jgi:protein-glutamine gamma-glutamyltransferase
MCCANRSGSRGAEGMFEFLKKFKEKKHPPEESILLRLSILLMLLTGIIAVLHQQEWPGIGLLIIPGTIVGFYVSYVRRNKKNTMLKVILAFLMLVALFEFLRNLRYSAYDPRVPLANLLLWLQLLHSFDLPSRRDLNYSMLVGLILISVSTVIAMNSSVIIYIVVFLVFSTIAMIYNNSSRFGLNAENKTELPLQFVCKTAFAVISVLIVATVGVFLFIPRLESLSIRPLPRSWTINLPSITMGRVFNPGQESSDIIRQKSGRRLLWNPDSYFGFSPYVNLNFRGHLSEKVVMKVKSNKWTYIRGLAFDRYDGTGWEIDGENEGDFERIYTPVPPHRIDPDDGIIRHWDNTVEIVQVFYIQRQMPNIIFGTYNSNLIFFPAETIYRDKNGGFRSPYYLEEGMIYSVLSRYVPMTGEMMDLVEKNHEYSRRIEQENETLSLFRVYPEDYFKYTQLPETLPERTRNFAGKILAEHDAQEASNLRKTFILSNYLRDTYPYDLDIPPFPDKTDVVDYFLFEQQRGYCEHFASALVIMLRTQGIPARMIFGYQPGEYDPVSGYYSVKQSDAHAWVEVYIPGYNWYAVDPTPGTDGSTFSASRNRNRWLFITLAEWIQDRMSNISIPRGKLVLLTAGLILFCTFLWLIVIYQREIKKYPKENRKIIDWLTERTKNHIAGLKKVFPIYEQKTSAHPAVNTYGIMVREFKKIGYVKKPSLTAREFVNKVLPEVFQCEAHRIVLIYETARYGINPPSSGELEEFDTLWTTLRKKIREYKKV